MLVPDLIIRLLPANTLPIRCARIVEIDSSHKADIGTNVTACRTLHTCFTLTDTLIRQASTRQR